MKTVIFTCALLAATAGVASADGWIDCNGPDKNGRGCDASGASTATTLAGLVLVTVTALTIGRKRHKD